MVTALYGSEGDDLADVAHHVGHSSTATMAGYVRNLGQLPKTTDDEPSTLGDGPLST